MKLSATSTHWNPEQYLKFSDHRLRPGLELLERIPLATPKLIYDLGCGTGDAAAAIARRLPEARITALDASPFMLIAARHQNAGIANLRFEQGFAEATRFEDASVDAVTITLVLHECPDEIKCEILAEGLRILRPSGTLVLSDTGQEDLHGYRGFYEPYKEQWLVFDPPAFLRDAGFAESVAKDVAPPLWSFVARRPA